MSLWLMALHLFNFVAPAIGLALMAGVVEMFSKKKRPMAHALIASAAMYFWVAFATLLLGLAVLGRDGKMLTYAAMVMALGTLAAWRHR